MRCFSTIHPARVFRDPYLIGPLIADFTRFANLLNGDSPDIPNVFVEDKNALLRILGSKETLFFDIETGQGSMETCPITLISVGNHQAAVSFRWPPPQELISALEDPQRPKGGANLFWFDIPILARHGIQVRGRIDDIRDLRRTIAPDSPVSVSYIKSLYGPVCFPWKANADTQDPVYNATDSLREAQAFRSMKEDAMTADPKWWHDWGETLYQQNLRIAALCRSMYTVGIRVDLNTRDWFHALLLQWTEQEREELCKLLPGIRPGNHEDLRAIVYAECAVPELPNFGRFCPPMGTPEARLLRTPSGRPSTNQNALIKILNQPGCPEDLKTIVSAFWKAEFPRKLDSTFVSSKKVIAATWADGRVHPSWNNAGNRYADGKDSQFASAATGRFRSQNPNFQNIPPSLLSMYVPAKGHKLIKLDYEGAELHSMFINTHDVLLGKMLSSGNVHNATAILWFKLPPETTKKTCPDRMYRCAKAVRLASGYRAGLDKIKVQIQRRIPDLTGAEIEFLYRKFISSHPEMVKWWHEIHTKVTKRGYSEDLMMHARRYYPRAPDPSESANYPNQRLVANVINSACVGPHHSKKVPLVDGLPRFGAKIIIQKHDEVVLEVPDEQAVACRDYAVETMEGPWNFEGMANYRMPVDAKIVENWGQ